MNEMSVAGVGHVGKTVTFASEDEHKLFVDDVKSTNLMVSRFGSGHYVGLFDTSKIDFGAELRSLIIAKRIASADIVNKEPLERLHKYLPAEAMRLDDSELNSTSKKFYDTSEPFLALYRRFFRQAVGELFGEDLYFQVTPTLRFQVSASRRI